MCGKKYAIEQSFKYHVRTAHGSDGQLVDGVLHAEDALHGDEGGSIDEIQGDGMRFDRGGGEFSADFENETTRCKIVSSGRSKSMDNLPVLGRRHNSESIIETVVPSKKFKPDENGNLIKCARTASDDFMNPRSSNTDCHARTDNQHFQVNGRKSGSRGISNGAPENVKNNHYSQANSQVNARVNSHNSKNLQQEPNTEESLARTLATWWF